MATKYKDWRPTQFDAKGLGLEDRQEWLVAPVIRTRDSGPLAESNFISAREILLSAKGADEDMVEVHRFGHWGPGWVEILLVFPSLKKEVEDLEDRLENYPVLDESDWSEREFEAAYEAWENWECDQFIQEITEVFGLQETTKEFLEDLPKETLWHFHLNNANVPYEWHNDHEVYFSFGYLMKMSRKVLAQQLREWREDNRRAA